MQVRTQVRKYLHRVRRLTGASMPILGTGELTDPTVRAPALEASLGSKIWSVVKNMSSGFKSWPYCLLANSFSSLTCLRLSFLICKMITLILQIKWVTVRKTLRRPRCSVVSFIKCWHLYVHWTILCGCYCFLTNPHGWKQTLTDTFWNQTF